MRALFSDVQCTKHSLSFSKPYSTVTYAVRFSNCIPYSGNFSNKILKISDKV